jgi:hypothetical protein
VTCLHFAQQDPFLIQSNNAIVIFFDGRVAWDLFLTDLLIGARLPNSKDQRTLILPNDHFLRHTWS